MHRLPPDPFIIHWREPEPSFWRLYTRRDGVLVPARLFACNHEPGVPENKRDRWPETHLAGEIAGRWVHPHDIWWRVLLRETRPRHWKCAQPLVPKDGLSEAEEYQFLMSEMTWLKENEPSSPLAKPYKPVRLAALPLPFGERQWK